jgi:predicted ArsR family transcriptional regulator
VEVEVVFCSRPRVKVLKIFLRLGQLNVSEVAHRLGINYEAALRHLKMLEDEGILQHRVYGRIRLYKFNEGSSKAKAVRNLLETWENLEKG